MTDVERVVLFGIDGLRPDALPLAFTPEIDRLVASGAHTRQGQSFIPSVSLPCWTSAFLGVPPSRHGIMDNQWAPPQPPVPSLFDVVHDHGKKAASFYNWEELRDLSRPGTLDVAHFRHLGDPEGDCDLEIGAVAATAIVDRLPTLAFVYLGALDEVGHRHGWMSGPYLHALEKADRAIGLVRQALQSSGPLNRSVFLVLSDHGGHGRDHGQGTTEDLTVPWIISGPGIRQGHSIRGAVSLMDTAPTVAHLLGLPRPEEWLGKAATEALTL